MSGCLEQVTTSVTETVFHSATSYSWRGHDSARLSPRIKRAMTPMTARNYILYQLQSQLYADFYILGGTLGSVFGNQFGTRDSSLVDSLSAANAGTGCRESGWVVQTSGQEVITVRRGGLQLWVAPEDCFLPEGGRFEVGRPVTLRLPKDLPGISPGYYMALSDQEDVTESSAPLVRMYWNLRADGAVPLMAGASRVLNGSGLFFRLKVLNDSTAFSRCDAAVLYFRKADQVAVMRRMASLLPQVKAHMKLDTPVFTKRLAPGLGLAEDPGKDESFGQHRCRLLSEGLIRAYEQGAQSVSARVDVVKSHFASEGIRLDEPYLNPQSKDEYEFQS